MINIFMTVDVIGYPTGYIIIEIVDAAAPSVTVDFQSFTRPGTNPGNVSFTGLPEATYIINIYSNTSPVVGGTRIRTYTIDKSFVNQEDREDLYLIGGVTNGMTVGQGTFADPDGLLTGWNYSLERRGVGTLMQPGVEYTQLSGGGWILADPDDQIGEGDIFVVHFRSMFTVSAPQPVNAGALFTPAIVIDTDTLLDITYQGKFCLIQGSGSTISLTLPAISAVPPNKMFAFLSDGGSHIMANLICAGSDQFAYLNDLRNTLYLGQGETLWIFHDGTNWRVATADGNFKSVGTRIGSYSLDVMNAVQCAGQTLLRAEYPRLWEWIQTKLDPALIVSDATWNFQNVTTLNYESHGLFSEGDGSTTFRLPVWYGEFDGAGGKVNGGTGFMRGVDGSVRKAGSMERDTVGNFKADITGKIVRKAEAANRTLLALNNLPPDGDLGSQAVPNVAFTGKDPITNVATNQTKPANTGEYALILY